MQNGYFERGEGCNIDIGFLEEGVLRSSGLIEVS